MPSGFWAGYRGTQFPVRGQRHIRKTRRNMLGSSFFADASYVSNSPASLPRCRFWITFDTDRRHIMYRMEVNWLLSVTEYGERWREGRKIADRSLRPGAISLYHQRIEKKTHALLRQLLSSPAEFRGHIELSVFLFFTSVVR